MGLRRLLAYPLAVPPVRRRLLVRLMPELLALAVWGLFLYLWLAHKGQWGPGLYQALGLAPCRWDSTQGPWALSLRLERAARVAHEAGGLLLVFAPVAFAASAFAAEREAGTLESLLLTSTHHHLLVRGRFWFAALPWFRLAAYLLPLYLALGFQHVFSFAAASWSLPMLDFWAWAFRLGRAGSVFVWNEALTEGASRHTLFLAFLRWTHDLSAMVLSVAAVFWISLRARSTVRAALLGFLAAPFLLLVLASPDLIWLLASLAGRDLALRTPMQYYWATVLLVVVLRWAAALRLVGRAAGNFDAYVLGERPDPPGERRRRSSRMPARAAIP